MSQLKRSEAITKIYDLENKLLARDDCLYLEDMEYQHWFAPGLYGRQITMPANLALTTMIHASENIAILAKGKMTIYSENGIDVIEAPHVMITKIGTKRAIYCHSEVVFITVHHNPENEKDIDALINKMTFRNEQEFLEYQENQK
jgi:hypothetical protein